MSKRNFWALFIVLQCSCVGTPATTPMAQPKTPPNSPPSQTTFFSCPDGTYADSAKLCDDVLKCPLITPYKCWDATCVTKSANCPAQITTCPSTTSHLCPNGDCIASSDSCLDSATCPAATPLVCPGQTCVAKEEHCVLELVDGKTPKPAFIKCDGVWVRNPFICSVPNLCPSDKHYRCWNNTCSAGPKDCPKRPGCMWPKPFACPLGGCVETIADCTTSPSFIPRFICADGTWSISPSHCGTPVSCPTHTPYKCWDETCRKVPADCPAEMKCPVTAPYLCPNGQCGRSPDECRIGVSCPNNMPVKCPNQQCVANVSKCADIY